jgi:hypothetical protein
MKQTPEQLFEQLSKEFAPKKEKEVINEALGEVVTLKPINTIEPTPKADWENKFSQFLSEADSLEPIVNNEEKINTKEEDDKVKAEVKKVSKPVENIESHNYDYSPSVDNINNVNAQEMLNGIQCEINYNSELTLDEAKEIAVKNLAKDPLHYVKDGQFGVKGVGYSQPAVQENNDKNYGGSGYSEKLKDGSDKMVPVKENKETIMESFGQVVTSGNPNSFAAMSGEVIKKMMAEKEEKALPMDENLNSVEQEKVMSALNNYVEKFKPNFGKVAEIADMLSELTGISSNKIQGYLMQLTGGDDEMIFEMEDEGTAVSYSDTMQEKKEDMDEGKGKDHDGDGDIDSDDYLAARDKAIKKAMGKKPKKESIETKLAEIGKAGEITKLEAQLEFLSNHIDEKIQRVSSINEDDNLSELVDKKKMKDMMKEIKLLEKRKGKMEKMYEKMSGKSYKKPEMVDEVEELEEMDAVSYNEKNNPTRSKEVGERDPKKVGKSTSAYAVNQP